MRTCGHGAKFMYYLSVSKLAGSSCQSLALFERIRLAADRPVRLFW